MATPPKEPLSAEEEEFLTRITTSGQFTVQNAIDNAARLRAIGDEGLESGPATPDTQADEDELLAIARGTPSTVELLSLPEAADIEFEPPKADFTSPPADLDDEDKHAGVTLLQDAVEGLEERS